jgi:hypothetical protein
MGRRIEHFQLLLEAWDAWAKDSVMQPPGKPNGGDPQTILNQTPIPCPASLTFSKAETTSVLTSEDKHQVDCTGYVGKQPILYFAW